MSMHEDSSSEFSFNLSGVKYDNERDLSALGIPGDELPPPHHDHTASNSFLDVICYDDSYEYTDYFAFVKDLPNEILVNIFAQLCFKDLCMIERGSHLTSCVYFISAIFLRLTFCLFKSRRNGTA
jgi:hypothetical protein